DDRAYAWRQRAAPGRDELLVERGRQPTPPIHVIPREQSDVVLDRTREVRGGGLDAEGREARGCRDEDRQPLRAERVRDDRRRGVEAAADLIRRRRLGIAERRVARRAAADLGDEAVPVLLRAAQGALGGGVPARGGRLL